MSFVSLDMLHLLIFMSLVAVFGVENQPLPKKTLSAIIIPPCFNRESLERQAFVYSKRRVFVRVDKD